MLATKKLATTLFNLTPLFGQLRHSLLHSAVSELTGCKAPTKAPTPLRQKVNSYTPPTHAAGVFLCSRAIPPSARCHKSTGLFHGLDK